MTPFDRSQPHPFKVWNETPRHERSQLARRATFHHPTTADLLASYYAHNLHMDGAEVKSAAEICRDLQGTVRPNQVVREARTFDPALADELRQELDR